MRKNPWPGLLVWSLLLANCGVTGEVQALPCSQPVGLAAGTADRPNILVVLVDDWGVMDSEVPFLLDENGRPQRHPLNDRYRTPNLARLAGQGVRFSNFLAMSVCSPTRISLLTGQTSARHRTTNWIQPDKNNAGEFGPRDWNWQGITTETVSLPRLLGAAGYRTIQVGKGHLGPFGSPGADPRTAGFDVSIAGSAMGQPGSYFSRERFGNAPDGPRPRGVPGLEAYHAEDIFLTSAETRELGHSIRTAVSEGQPFFALMSHYAVHAPFQADPRFIGHYGDEPPEFAAFASLVEGVDYALGETLLLLKELDVARNTLVFVLGDNGSDAPLGDDFAVSCAAPLRGKKGTHFEGGMRTALLVAWAEIDQQSPLQQRIPVAASAATSQLAAIYDLFPTMLAVAGRADHVPAGHVVDGINLLERLANPTAPEIERDFLMHYPHEHRGNYFTVFRRGDWKLVYHWRRNVKDRCELYDLAADPAEQVNLAGQEPGRLKALFEAMVASLQATAAQPPLGDDRETPLEPVLHPAGA
jgi:arylsulfatase A-like enzyme